MRSRPSSHAVVVLCIAAGTPGCAQLFGLSDTTLAPDAPPPDTVSLALDHVSVGATVVHAPADLTGQTAMFLVDDPAAASGIDRIAATQTAPGTWSADIADGTPPILFTSADFPDPVTRYWAFGQRHVKNVQVNYEHPGAAPPPAAATLAVTVTLPSAYVSGETFQVSTIGSWANHGMGAAELPAPDTGVSQIGPVSIPFDTTAFSQPFGRPLTAITAADAVLVLRYVGVTLTGALDAPGFAQTGTDALGGAMVAVAADQTLDITTSPTDPATRLALVMPAPPVGTPTSMGWAVHAAPGYTYGLDAGPALASGGGDPASTGVIKAMYGNPFGAHGWSSIFTLAANITRTYTDPTSMLPVTLYAGMNTYVEPTAALQVDHTAALPTLVTLAGVALATDGLSVPIDQTKQVDIQMTTDAGKHTFCQFILYELVPNAAGTALEQRARLIVDVLGLTARVPPDLFVSGHTYEIRAQCADGGYPGIATGDLQTRVLPTSLSFLDSGVFTVTP